jgi:hypothetical protein
MTKLKDLAAPEHAEAKIHKAISLINLPLRQSLISPIPHFHIAINQTFRDHLSLMKRIFRWAPAYGRWLLFPSNRPSPDLVFSFFPMTFQTDIR